jgi:hypothetical protein
MGSQTRRIGQSMSTTARLLIKYVLKAQLRARGRYDIGCMI